MKTLILVRHAKSDWTNAGTSDHDRVLNARGKKDAPVMAERLKEKIEKPDLIISSSAVRALTTAETFAEEFKIKSKDIQIERSLYLADPETFYNVLLNVPGNVKKVVIFSHNPGITEFANKLTTVHVDDMPTCAMYALKIDIKEWSDFRTAEKQFFFFDYPKLKD
jgi:phosphohistidine phosphatase